MNSANALLWGVNVAVTLLAAPLIPGVINKTKAFFAGRKGPRVLQLYSDLFKLLRKSTVYCQDSGAIFRMSPALSLASTLGCVALMPVAAFLSPVAFPGDMILFLYLFGMSRLFSVFAAMETASSFEGMGSSRECQFSALSEGSTIAVFGALVMLTGKFSLSGCLNTLSVEAWTTEGTALLLVIVAFYLVTLTETCRVPVDDPETHLELTMIHEAMILDNSGPDLAVILYNAALKMWVFLSFLAMLILPKLPGGMLWEIPAYFGLMFALTVSVGVVESIMARYRFLKVPQLLAGAFCLTTMAVVLLIVFQGGVR